MIVPDLCRQRQRLSRPTLTTSVPTPQPQGPRARRARAHGAKALLCLVATRREMIITRPANECCFARNDHHQANQCCCCHYSANDRCSARVPGRGGSVLVELNEDTSQLARQALWLWSRRRGAGVFAGVTETNRGARARRARTRAHCLAG